MYVYDKTFAYTNINLPICNDVQSVPTFCKQYHLFSDIALWTIFHTKLEYT